MDEQKFATVLNTVLDRIIETDDENKANVLAETCLRLCQAHGLVAAAQPATIGGERLG